MLAPLAIESKPLDYSGQRIVNGFIRPTDGVSQGVVIGASGTLANATLSAGNPVRAMIKHGEVLHAVANGKLYSIASGVATELATIADGDTYLASSGTELAIVANETYYLWNGSTLSTPTTGAITTPRSVTFLDGYFIVSGTDGTRADTFSISGINNGASFAGLDFATAENSPDKIVRVIADHGQLYFFGSDTTEVWYNSGNADFPFTPNAGAIVQQGCGNAQSVAQLDNSLFWVSPENTVLRSGGGIPEVISTREIETVLKTSTIEAGFAYFDKGHLCYAIRRTGDTTLCYDVTTQKWHERAQGTLGLAPWSACCSVNVDGTQYVGTSSGKIATLDPDTYTDDSDVLPLMVTTSPAVFGPNGRTVGRVYIQVKSGGVDIGRDPIVTLQTSKNGKDFTQGRYRSLGRLGQYVLEPQWNGLGHFRTFWARVTITDPVPRDIHGVIYE